MKTVYNKFLYIFLGAFVLLSGCHSRKETIEPKLNYAVQDKYLKRLPSPFKPLTFQEKEEDWGKEYLIGQSFARQLDLYQAITAFKRADILCSKDNLERKREIQYEIILCYFLGKKYSEVLHTYDQSDLRTIDKTFPTFRDLLIILYDSYFELREYDKASRLLECLKQYDPAAEEKLELYSLFMEGNVEGLKAYPQSRIDAEDVQKFVSEYQREKKSPAAAQALNAFVPGAGYLYLGQKQSALTAFLLNGLFIGATTYFFMDGNIAAGIIFASFEAGWYFGGIKGAKEETKFYNERVFERVASPMMNQKGLFPVLTLNYAF